MAAPNIGNATEFTRHHVLLGALSQFGASELGQSVGERSRRISSTLAKLPLFSLSSDVMKERNGVPKLLQHLQEDASDPLRHLWLAEALSRTRKDQTLYRRARSVVDPTFLIVSKTVKAANSLGQVDADAPEMKLYKSAFKLSMRSLKSNPRNAVALGVLARVYQAQGMAGEAVKHAKLACLADPTDLNAMATLARLYIQLEQFANAQKAAEKVIAGGHSYGYEILSDIVMLGEDEPGERMERYESLRGQVRPQDREQYHGPSSSGTSVLEGIGRAQWAKAKQLLA